MLSPSSEAALESVLMFVAFALIVVGIVTAFF
jgi:predicted nucleic acid-binding Zn ribbon protein